LIKPKTIVIPLKDLYPIVVTVTEDEHCRVKSVADMLKIYNGGKTVYSLAHIGRATDKINLFAFVVLEHENYPHGESPLQALQWELLAKGKGVHREVESEGSRRQILGPTNRNRI